MRPTTFSDSTARVSTATRAWIDVGSAKCGSGCLDSASVRQFREGVPGPLEELLGVRRVEGHRQLHAGAVAERGIGKGHGRRQAVGRQSRPRHVCRSRVRDGHQPDRAEATQGLGSHPGGLVVRAERAGHGGRTADDDDDDLALDVEAREIVEAGFGHLQPVAREHERGVHARGGIDPQPEDGLLAEDERSRLAVPHQREARLGLEQAPRRKDTGCR